MVDIPTSQTKPLGNPDEEPTPNFGYQLQPLPQVNQPAPAAPPPQRQEEGLSPHGEMLQQFNQWAKESSQQSKDNSVEQADVDYFLRSLNDLPEDEGDHPAWMSAAGRRLNAIEEYSKGLSEQGQRFLWSRVQSQIDRDKEKEQEERSAAIAKATQDPSAWDKTKAYVGPYLAAASDPLHHASLGLIPSFPWANSLEKGVNDAMLQTLAQSEMEQGASPEEAYEKALERVQSGDIPTGMKLMHMTAMIPEIGYSLPAFMGIEALSAGAATPAVLARLGMTGKKAMQYGKMLERGLKSSDRASRNAAKLQKLFVDTAKKGDDVAFALGQAPKAARTFGLAGAIGAPVEDEEGNWETGYFDGMWDRFTHGALGGFLAGGVAQPAARQLGKVLPGWMRGDDYWMPKAASHYNKKYGIPTPVASNFKPTTKMVERTGKAGKAGLKREEYGFQVGEKWLPIKKLNQGVDSYLGKMIDLPGRIGEGGAFAGISMAHGVADPSELFWQFGSGFLLKGQFAPIPIPGLQKLKAKIPGTPQFQRQKLREEITDAIVLAETQAEANRRQLEARANAHLIHDKITDYKDKDGKLATLYPTLSPGVQGPELPGRREVPDLKYATAQGGSQTPLRVRRAQRGQLSAASEVTDPGARGRTLETARARMKDLEARGQTWTKEYREYRDVVRALDQGEPGGQLNEGVFPYTREVVSPFSYIWKKAYEEGGVYERARKELFHERTWAEYEAYREAGERTFGQDLKSDMTPHFRQLEAEVQRSFDEAVSKISGFAKTGVPIEVPKVTRRPQWPPSFWNSCRG